MKSFWVICLVILPVNLRKTLHPHSPEVAAHYEKELIKLLEMKAPKHTPPNGAGHTDVMIDPMLRQLLDVNEREGYWVASIIIPVKYENQNITWNPADYGNITFIQVQPDVLWVPVVGK